MAYFEGGEDFSLASPVSHQSPDVARQEFRQALQSLSQDSFSRVCNDLMIIAVGSREETISEAILKFDTWVKLGLHTYIDDLVQAVERGRRASDQGGDIEQVKSRICWFFCIQP